jgi:urate oxidase
MGVKLGHNQYGKAENRVVRVFRDSDPHEIVDYNVSVALWGGQEAAHLEGDNSPTLPTDTQKNTVYSYAKEAGDAVRQPESFGIALARHFVDDIEPITHARVKFEMYPWSRGNNPHAFVRDGRFVRTATITYDGTTTWVVSGVKALSILKTSDSEYQGFLKDKYTTLKPTGDRIVATSVTCQWWHTSEDVDWGKSHDTVVQAIIDTYGNHYSLGHQQTLFEVGTAVLNGQPQIAQFRITAPNLHHFDYDLARFGVENNNEVFHADDRPYGLQEVTVLRDDSPDPGLAFDPGQGW